MFMLVHALGITGPLAIVLGVILMVGMRFLKGGNGRQANRQAGRRGW
jgi:hypothetical protein